MSKIHINRIIEEIRALDISADMSWSCLMEIRETLKLLECMHQGDHGESTPPMFFPEWILCIVSRAKLEGIKAGLNAPDISLEQAKEVWNKYRNTNEM